MRKKQIIVSSFIFFIGFVYNISAVFRESQFVNQQNRTILFCWEKQKTKQNKTKRFQCAWNLPFNEMNRWYSFWDETNVQTQIREYHSIGHTVYDITIYKYMYIAYSKTCVQRHRIQVVTNPKRVKTTRKG